MLKCLAAIGASVTLLLIGAAPAHAQTYDQRVLFTFNQPVDLPGVALKPGTYLFHLPDPTNASDVVQVLSADGRQSYGMFFTWLGAERTEPASKPEVRFMETPAGTPPAIDTYWMPGERVGREFIYPKAQALEFAKASTTPVLTTMAQTSKTEETHTKALARVSSSGTSTPVSASAKRTISTASGRSQQGEPAPASTQIAQAKIPPVNEGTTARATLPKTGSSMPFVALGGLIFVSAAGTLRLASYRRR